MFEKIKNAGNWTLFFQLLKPKSVEEAFSLIIILVIGFVGGWWFYSYGLKGDFDIVSLFRDQQQTALYQTNPADFAYQFNNLDIDPLVIEFGTDLTNVDLSDEAQHRGWTPGQDIIVKIAKGAVIGAQSATRAALTVTGFSDETKVSIINAGEIIGAGGAGGAGAEGFYPRFSRGLDGQDGGAALHISSRVNLVNRGVIAGGGGGGGGGGGSWIEADDVNGQSIRYLFSGGGGGGGQGTGTSLGGDAGEIVTESRGVQPDSLETYVAEHGKDGSRTQAGIGGRKNIEMPLYAAGGSGGTGGALGKEGGKGENASKGGVVDPRRGRPGSARGAYGGAGGKAGSPIDGIAYVAILEAGTMLGENR